MRVLGGMLIGWALVVAACSGSATTTTGTLPEGGSTTTVASATTTVPQTTAAPVTTAPVTTVAPATTEPATTTAAPTTTAATTTTTAAPTTTLPSGAPSATCINGWITPTPGTALRKRPLDLIGRPAGDLFIVEEMRYFTGPEDVDIIEPRRQVERWYVEAHMQNDPSIAGRWIVREVNVGAGVFAEAPAGTTGFAPGTWTAYRDDGWTEYDPFTPACTADNGPFCACAWGAMGCSCSDDEQMICTGLPASVMGCLDGL